MQCTERVSCCQRFGHKQRNCGYAPGSQQTRTPTRHGSVWPQQHLKCCSSGGNHIAKFRGCYEWKETEAAAVRRAQGERSRRDGVSMCLLLRKQLHLRSLLNKRLGSGWNHDVQGGRMIKAQNIPYPNTASFNRNEQQAIRASSPCKAARLVASVVETQLPYTKHADSTASTPPSQSPPWGDSWYPRET
jgi:hypothetical protein